MRATHTQVRPLPGRDLTPLLLGEKPPKRYNAPQYFMTDDMVSSGFYNVAPSGMQYAPVVQPAHVETVIAYLPTGPGKAAEQWKYSRYFDNTAFWSSPGTQDVFTLVEGVVSKAGNHPATTTVKTQPVPDEIEVYNVTQDPTEMNNLAADPASAATVARLQKLLNGQRKKKRLEPKTLPRYQGPPGGIGV